MGRGVQTGRTNLFQLCTGTRAASEDAAKPAQRVACIIALVILVDVGLSVCAQWLIRGGIVLRYSLKSDASDLVALALGRSVALPLVAWTGRAAWTRATRARPRSDEYVRLGDGGEFGGGDAADVDGSALARRKLRADFRRDAWLALLFLLASVCQAYVGVKLCVFRLEGARHATAFAICAGVTTICVNAEAWLLSNVVRLTTRLSAAAAPGVHKHPLEPAPTTNHWCDICGTRVTAPTLWRCNECNFDVCPTCWDRAHRRRLDGASTAVPNPLREVAAGGSTSGNGLRRRRAAPTPQPEAASAEEASIGSWEILREVFALMAPDWWLVSTALLCVVGSSAASLALPSYQGQIIDAVYAGERGAFRRKLALYLAFSVGTAVTQALRALCFQVTGRRLACALRNRLYRAILRQDVAFFDGTASGALTSRLTVDVNQMCSPLTTLLGTLTSACISLLGGIAMAFYTSWRLSMLAFTTVGPIMHVTQAYAEWSREQNRKILAHLGEANAVATEALANVRTVKAMATDDAEASRYEGHTLAARDRGVVDASLSATTQLVNNVLDYGAGWLILFYGGADAMRKGSELSAGKLVTYQLYFNKIQSSYNQLISLLSSFTRASGAAQRVLGLLRSMPSSDGGGAPVAGARGHLAYRGVAFAYATRPDRVVLESFDLDVPAGSTLALVGKSGSGKTTALHLLLRFYDPSAGSIALDGADLRSLDVRGLRRQFAIVAQETQLFNTTIGGNVAYGAREAGEAPPDDAAMRAASKAALADGFITDFPHGYETRVGERGVRVSGGQKQRIAIARAFLRDPRVLLLDEATSALDAESEAKVQQSLDALIAKKSATVVLVAHRLSTVRNADAIAVVGDGRILELGDHDSLIERDGIYATLVRRQLQASANTISEDKVDEAAREVDVDSLIAAANRDRDLVAAGK